MTVVEIREFRAADLVVESQGQKSTFTGYAAVFDSPSEPLPFVETIAPGAFGKSLRSRNDIRMYLNHDDSMVLASRRSGTLKLEEDAKGLKVTATLPDTSYARDLRALMTGPNPIVDSMSFGFSVPRGGDTWSEDRMQRRLHEVRLHEVSVVTGVPAYAATSAMVRKMTNLAQRSAADVDELAASMNALLDGSLTSDQAALLRTVVDAATPTHDHAPDLPLDVLRQRLDLAAKAV